MKHLKISISKFFYFFFIIGFINQTDLYAQTKSITGIVIDGITNEPLIGVNVLILTQNKGTSTNMDGRFTIDVQTNQMLRFSYLGYENVEVVIKNSQSLTVKMLPDTKALSEVVVIGYGTRQKVSLTGAVSSVGDTPFQNKPTSNAVFSLQGQIPGLTIQSSNGLPGQEGWKLQIRGASSTNNVTPLLVIDGMPTLDNSALEKINASDIENISVLKDASAAIYGSRAAGGVILITTRKGVLGKNAITYEGSLTYESLGRNRRVLTPTWWFNTVNDAYTNDGQTEQNPFYRYKEQYLQPDNGLTIFRPGPFQDTYEIPFFDTNYSKELYGMGISTKHELSFSGGGEKSRYFASTFYVHQDNPLKKGKLYDDKYGFRVNYVFNANSKLSINPKIDYTHQYNIQPSLLNSTFGAYGAWATQPGLPLYSASGNPYAWGAQPSIAGVLENTGNFIQTWSRLNSNVEINYNISPDLKLVGQIGLSNWWYNAEKQIKQARFYSYDDKWSMLYPNINDTEYSTAFDIHTHEILQAYLNYTKSIVNNHNVAVMVGASTETENYKWLNSGVKKINTSAGDVKTLSMGDPTTLFSGENKYAWRLASYFGRFNYDYKSKYLLEANLREDGSSKFVKEKRWKMFGGVSLGWRISEEGFMCWSTKYLNNLKLRASYGTTGNQEGIGLYDYIQLISLNGFYPFGMSYTKYQTAQLGSIISLDRTWERIENKNVGLDFTLFENKLSGSFDRFMKRNKNMLISLSYPAQLGENPPKTNNGQLSTRGYEILINWQDKIDQLNYSLSFNFAESKTNIDYINGGDAINQMGPTYARQGYPLNSYFGYNYLGVIKDNAALEAYQEQFSRGGIPVVKVGDAMYEDLNNDNVLDVNDMKYIGSLIPRYTYGVNLGLEAYGVDFSAFIQGVSDVWTYRKDERPFIAWWWNGSANFYGKTYNSDQNSERYNVNAYYPRLTVSNNDYNWLLQSTKNVLNQSYFRIKTIILGYTMPENIINKVGLDKVRFFISGNNVWEWVKTDDGYDPERLGDDYNVHPSTRSWTVGATINF